RPAAPRLAHPGNASHAAFTAASTAAGPPAATSARRAPSIGDRTSSRPSPKERGAPPIQWSVSTDTPATVAAVMPRLPSIAAGRRDRGAGRLAPEGGPEGALQD